MREMDLWWVIGDRDGEGFGEGSSLAKEDDEEMLKRASRGGDSCFGFPPGNKTTLLGKLGLKKRIDVKIFK